MKVCLIGCGDIANAAHGPALARLKQEGKAELAGCCNRTIKKAEAFKEKFGFDSAWSDYHDMLDALHPEVVFVLLPVNRIAAAAADIMKMGYPLIMEKPPGLDTAETDMLINTAKEFNAFNAVMFNRRSMPLLVRLKEELQGRAIDSITLEMCRFNRANGEDFTTTAIHGIDCVSYLAGQKYRDLSFFYDEHTEAGYTNYHIHGQLAGGTRVDMHFMPVAGAVTERLTVYVHNAQYYLNLPVWSGTEYTNGFDHPGHLTGASGQMPVLDIDGREYSNTDEGFVLNGFYDEDRLLLDAIRNGKPSPHEIKTGRQSVEIMLAMRKRIPHMNWEVE